MAFEDALKREAKKQITETANKLQTKITASTQGLTAAMSTISFALDLSGMLAAFGEIRPDRTTKTAIHGTAKTGSRLSPRSTP